MATSEHANHRMLMSVPASRAACLLGQKRVIAPLKEPLVA